MTIHTPPNTLSRSNALALADDLDFPSSPQEDLQLLEEVLADFKLEIETKAKLGEPIIYIGQLSEEVLVGAIQGKIDALKRKIAAQ